MSESLKLKQILVEDKTVILMDKLLEARIFPNRNAVIGAAMASLMAGLIELQRQQNLAKAQQAAASEGPKENVAIAERPGDTGESENAEGPGTGEADRPVSQEPA